VPSSSATAFDDLPSDLRVTLRALRGNAGTAGTVTEARLGPGGTRPRRGCGILPNGFARVRCASCRGPIAPALGALSPHRTANASFLDGRRRGVLRPESTR